MNAFLIFCKRHRAQVREKYPHLENRQVTKILGEWWADLPLHHKTSYTELARQYKEAFLRANPDFKWYKIPAQPPRPPPARPSNQKVPRCNPLPATDGAITFGKLADEAQMGGLSTLMSPATSSSVGSSATTSLTTTYTSATFTPVPGPSPPGSFSTSSFSSVCGSLLSTTVATAATNAAATTSMSTNTAATSLPSWQRLAPLPSVAATCNGPRSVATSEVAAGNVANTPPPPMNPHMPPKKRYIHENLLNSQVSTPPQPLPQPPPQPPPGIDRNKVSLDTPQKSLGEDHSILPGGWPGRPRVEYDGEGIDRLQRHRPPNGCVPSPDTPHGPAPPTHPLLYPRSPPRDDQPLNLTTETTLCASQQQLINNIVDKMCAAPNHNNASVENRSDFPRFFRPENLNNNNNEIEKPAFHKAIDARINGMCDVSLIVSKVSQTIDFVIDRAYDDEKEKKDKLQREEGKGPPQPENKTVSSTNGTTEAKQREEGECEGGDGGGREAVSSTNTNGVSVQNSRARKRPKEDGSEEVEVTQKKRREASGRMGRSSGRGGSGVTGGRSRAPRACKGKIYEELISEGVLPAPRRARSRNTRLEESEGGGGGLEREEEENNPPAPHQEEEEEEENEETMEEVVLHSKPSEVENGEGTARRTEDGGRRGRRQLRRLHPDDFNLEARIEALPSLSLDEFTRRKKERKRTSSAPSTPLSSTPTSTSVTSTPSQVTGIGVVSSSSRVSAVADSTSDPLTIPPSSSTSTTTTTTTSPPASPTPTTPRSGVTSSINGGIGGNSSDGETTSSPTPSSSSSSQLSPSGESGGGAGLGGDGGPLIGSQRRKARKQTITRHDPVNAPLRRDTSVVEQSVLTSMGLAALAEVALSQPVMKL